MLNELTIRLFAAVTLAVIGSGCGADSAKNATFVEPVYEDPCRDFDCMNQGACVASDGGAPSCVCEGGYLGEHCELCEAGFHRDAARRCVPDKRCADQLPNPCGAHGECGDAQGVIECACDTGYEGPRCALCAPGYQADPVGDCLLKVIEGGLPSVIPAACDEATCNGHGQCSSVDGMLACECYAGYVGPSCDQCASGHSRPEGVDRCVPILECNAGECGGCALFDGGADFPEHPDACVSRKELQLEDVTLWSLGGDGLTWLCSASTRYALDSEHVALEAGANQPAELTFRSPVHAVSFDYVTWDDASLELTGDGEPVGKLIGERHVAGSITVELDPPVSVLGLRSLDEFAHAFALDNVIYSLDPTVCE